MHLILHVRRPELHVIVTMLYPACALVYIYNIFQTCILVSTFKSSPPSFPPSSSNPLHLRSLHRPQILPTFVPSTVLAPHPRFLHRSRKLPRPLIIDIDILPEGPGPILEIDVGAYSLRNKCMRL